MHLKLSIQAWKFQSRLKISISPENVNPSLDNSPQIEVAFFSFSLGMFNLAWNFQSEIGRLKTSIQTGNLEMFQSLGPLGFKCRKCLRASGRDWICNWNGADLNSGDGNGKRRLSGEESPRALKDWKNSRFPVWIEIFKRPISDWNFQARLKISTVNGLIVL